VLVAVGVMIWRTPEPASRESLVIGTGSESGVYHAIGTALARSIERRGLAHRVEVRASQGSVENMRLLESGAVDLALIQSDTPPGPSARLIASLFDEELHVLVSRDLAERIRTVTDIDGTRVSLGDRESGTRQVAQRVLDHFEIGVAEDRPLNPEQAVDALETGEIDALFTLTAVPAASVTELARRDAVRFVTLGDPQLAGNPADALALIYPRLHPAVIPQSTYGHLPLEPTLTIGVTAELMCAHRLDDELVRDLTRAVFTMQTEGGSMSDAATAVAGRISERYVPGGGSVPYHRGAMAYYERFEPPFVVQYAEAISLGLTLLVGVWSGSVAIRQWIQRRKKNRIDAYYIEVTRDPPDLTSASHDELLARRAHLIKVRERAFADLVRERLEANESFSIFQNQVAGELASIAVTLQHIE
jgi:TRAP transporter TAXI family solute receptor